MGSKYIVRQPIKDASNKIIAYEIQYHGENQAFSQSDKSTEFEARIGKLYDVYDHVADEEDSPPV